MMFYSFLEKGNGLHTIVSLFSQKKNTTIIVFRIMTSSDKSSNNSCAPSFLRRLVEMLSENEDIISFLPGSVDKKGKVTLGRIIVHDRIRVESEVLPKYFNHSSFASLRRQLNYFSFARQGKGRQKGASYQNDHVIELEDILRLRRRPAAASIGTIVDATSTPVSRKSEAASADDQFRNVVSSPNNSITSKKRNRRDSTSTSGTNDSMKKYRSDGDYTKESAFSTQCLSPNVVSPRSSPSHSATPSPIDDEMRITLDLTIPPLDIPAGANTSSYHIGVSNGLEDADILAGCKALLSLSHGRNFGLKVWTKGCCSMPTMIMLFWHVLATTHQILRPYAPITFLVALRHLFSLLRI